MMQGAGLSAFLWGAIAMGCFVSGLFFFRFWRLSRDRLFVLFGTAFWMLAVHWSALAVASVPDEARYSLYLIRLAAFVLILAGVIDKNRR